MNTALIAGLFLSAIGIAGYAVGTATNYPGRAFALTATMVGLALVAIGSADDRRGEP